MSVSVLNTELDPTFRLGLKFLNSPNPDSAEKLRNVLDELIKSKHGPTKMLTNTLSAKHLSEEANFPDARKGRLKQIAEKTAQSQNTGTAIVSGDETVEIADEIMTTEPHQAIVVEVSEELEHIDDQVIEDEHFKELEDLMCIVCRQMDVSARNRLVECLDCHSLYHQECHKPIISETDVNDSSWRCTMCKTAKISPITTTTTTTSTTTSETTQTAITTTSSSSKSTSVTTTTASISTSSSTPVKSHSSSGSYSKSSSKHYESSSSSSSGSDTKKSSKTSSTSSPKSSSKNSSSSSSKSNGGSSSKQESSKNSNNSERSSNNNGSSSKSTSSGSSSSSVTPNINIISADKRLQIMKKKAAKLQETKRKHK